MKFCLNFHSRGYADGEIEAMFARYDVDGDRVLDEEEQRRMQADLFEQKVHSFFLLRIALTDKCLWECTMFVTT